MCKNQNKTWWTCGIITMMIFFSLKTLFYLPYHTGSKLGIELFSFRVPYLSQHFC